MKPIKIGVLGAGRGSTLAKNFMLLGCEIVALCENNPERVEYAKKRIGNDIRVFSDFDEFLQSGAQAVIIANNFHEHAPFAIKCLEKNIHVFSECISNSTMAEGVKLIRACQKSSAVYFLAENYPQMLFNLEMKKVCDGGSLGKILYAEGEYNHPVDPYDTSFFKEYVFKETHWRNYLPATYYITHSLGPVMRITGATPKRVSAMAIFNPETDPNAPVSKKTADNSAIIMTHNDDDSVFRITGCAHFGAHDNAYRICGTKGQVENLRGMGSKIMLRYNKWDKPEGIPDTMLYEPELVDKDKELIKKSGHGGSDFITARMFLDCIRDNKQPEHPFDVYSAVTMSSVAILAHRSVLGGGVSFDIPDFKDEAQLERYQNDNLSPFYYEDGRQPSIPCCSHPDYKPTDSQIAKYLEVLES